MVAAASFVHLLKIVNAILVLFSDFVNHLPQHRGRVTTDRCSSLIPLSTSNHDGCVKFREAPHVLYLIDAGVHQQT